MDYQAKLHKNIFVQGVTIVEIVVVVGIMMLLTSISLSAYDRFKSHENLEIATLSVVSALRYAASNAITGKNDSSWGVAIASETITVFQGESYLLRTLSRDKHLRFPAGMTIAGPSEMVFEKISGIPLPSDTFILTNAYGSQNIIVNEKGTITYE